jgi:hypothetical protein
VVQQAAGAATQVKAVQPAQGRAGQLGPGIGVVFKIGGEDTGGALSIVEHPFAVGALVQHGNDAPASQQPAVADAIQSLGSNVIVGDPGVVEPGSLGGDDTLGGSRQGSGVILARVPTGQEEDAEAPVLTSRGQPVGSG